MEEQRDPRFKCDLACNIGYSGRSYPGQVKDISLGGCMVETETLPQSASEVALAISTADTFCRVRVAIVHKLYVFKPSDPKKPVLQFGSKVLDVDEGFVNLVLHHDVRARDETKVDTRL